MARGAYWIVVYNHIPALIAAVESNTRAAVKRTADSVLRDAKGRIHRQSGQLQDTAFTQSNEGGKSASIEFPAPYAGFVEYGTYKMSPRPFLGPAIAAHEAEFFEACGPGAMKL